MRLAASSVQVYRGVVWCGIVSTALLLAVTLCFHWQMDCSFLGSWVLPGIFFLLRVARRQVNRVCWVDLSYAWVCCALALLGSARLLQVSPCDTDRWTA